MKLFRRKTFTEIHAADIEAARLAASGLGAFRVEGSPHSSAVVEPTPPAPAVEVARRGAQPAQEERPAGFPPTECRCGGHIGWIDRGDHWDGTCHGPCKMPHFRNKQREPRSIADLAETIDLLEQQNEALHRENKRLRSELNQAIAQRDIARAQRDEARATNGRMSP
jgi:hypothetical protein